MANRSFREGLRRLINEHSQESASNTPDFVLARFLAECLEVFDLAVTHREAWYGRYENPSKTGM